MKKILIFLLFAISLNADIATATTDFMQKDFKITLSWLQEKPKSPAKDFFIIQYLNQEENLSFEEAKTVYDMRYGKNASLDKLFNQRYKKNIPEEDLKCYRASIEELKNSDVRCIALGLSLKEASLLSKKDLEFFINKLDSYPTLKNNLKLISSTDPFNSFINSGTKKFLQLFFELEDSYTIKYLNKELPLDFLTKLTQETDFNRFLRTIIFNKDFPNIQKSLYALNSIKTFTPDIDFILGINAINNNNPTIAKSFFLTSFNKTNQRDMKDKATFWLYLVTKENYYLEELAKSWDNSLYVLYAKELLNIKPDNIIYNLETKNKKSSYDIYNAFDWLNVVEDTKTNLDDTKLQKYSNIFTDENTMPHLAFVLERYNKSKIQYFITPYKDIIGKYNIYKQILLYSLARQESRFIPSSISVSSALGVMQIMPFLSLDISQKLNEDYNIYEQFVPKKNIEYASFHLDTLMTQFDNNPLFIAYAYNGGGGYTKGQLKKGLFKEKGKFEPFLSMELISSGETREYGKKVLANFYIYNNYLNSENKISLSTILQNLVSPY
ncbi:lytic transglycosylase domain-containing protein [Aliarcobacter butzleri]|uniref:lytic transglycosylase domain-containing protein n=1 Tax=Aliarcobacter butzleri TaxID=28197 RepID=UPI00215B4B8B|nr:lytic transglycosylase domain-containing protein [Aliarcobacter butzleri]MCR8711385.1 lytic transglycosylase domain-containing protein [Aliarcobacter butzleri]